jgi:hypothetical protein
MSYGHRSEKGGELRPLKRERWRRDALTGWQAALRTWATARDFYAHFHGRRKTPPMLDNRDAALGDTTSNRRAPLSSNFLFQIFPKLVFRMGKVATN